MEVHYPYRTPGSDPFFPFLFFYLFNCNLFISSNFMFDKKTIEKSIEKNFLCKKKSIMCVAAKFQQNYAVNCLVPSRFFLSTTW